MGAVVSDTGPLNYLILIEAVSILPRLFSSVIIPAAVKAELSHREAPTVVRAWIAHPPSWLKVENLRPAVIPELSSLHSGEREVITLALEQPDLLILMDDRRGTVEARRRRITVIGTLAALDEAAARDWIDLPEMFSRLRSTSFRSPLRLMALMLDHDAQRKK
jgi:predicted nucleic acid-binding protein